MRVSHSEKDNRQTNKSVKVAFKNSYRKKETFKFPSTACCYCNKIIVSLLRGIYNSNKTRRTQIL